ncbi:MAG: hypothetical protein E7647_08900 [Ruminococcaceae bacterium]|nr:hypothetical protein [Oscillospiraceae bacterium]
MKKISIIALILAALMLFASCGKDTEKNEETTAPETEELKIITVDFEKVRVVDYAFAYENGEKVALANGKKAIESSKPSVATVDSEGNVVPHGVGVTLVAYENDKSAEAVAICVLPDGVKPDRASGGSAELVMVGETYMHTAPVGEVEYTSSDESVVDVSEAPKLAFVKSGYACVTCSSVSRPFTYSFVVYDRTVEK